VERSATNEQQPMAIVRLVDDEVARDELDARELALVDGTVARTGAGRTSLEFVRPDGTVLFRYDTSQGQGRITLENDAIDVHAARGDLRLRAAGDVVVEGRSIHAVSRVPGVETAGELRLGPRQASLSAGSVKLDGDDLEMRSQRTTLRSEDVSAFVGRAVVNAQRLETVAEVITETARDLYQSVAELAQLRAGSLRTIIDGTVHLKAKEVFQRALEGFKIRAEKIHLG
jgi:uncharacterized protein DUF3540